MGFLSSLIKPENTKPETRHAVRAELQAKVQESMRRVSVSPKEISKAQASEVVAPVEEAKKVENPEIDISGSIFVQEFLDEVKTYLEVGKELETLTQEKSQNSEKSTDEQKNIEAAHQKGQEIRSQIETLLQNINNENAKKSLNDVIASFDSYKNTLENELDVLNRTNLKSSNELLMKINAKKKSWEAIRQQLGGEQNINKVLAYINKAENIAERYNLAKGVEIVDTKSEIFNLVKHKMANAEAAKENKFHAGKGDILSLLINIFMGEK